VLASPYPLRSLLVLERRLSLIDDLRLPPGVAVYAVDDGVMAGVTGFNVHRGLLGLADRLPPRSSDELLATLRPPLPVVVEGVNDQENLGAIFRNAAAFGAGAVLLDPTCSDPLYRRSIRVSLGHVLRVPFARLEPWPGAISSVREAGYTLVALTPSRTAESVTEVASELRGARVALIVGAEGPGLSGEVLNLCRQVRIPMAAGVDSINVGAATAVALHRFSGDYAR
jgi:tRNA G18 (ribose-2'-O)-methylase SpoU